jgi:hypothetical protein
MTTAVDLDALYDRARSAHWKWTQRRGARPFEPARALSEVIANHNPHGPRIILRNVAGLVAVYDYDAAKQKLIRRMSRH